MESKVASIKKIESLGVELYSSDGCQKEFHSVVKNHPFNIRCGFELPDKVTLENQRLFNFHRITLEVTLCYDVFPLKKVDYVVQRPIEYSSRVLCNGQEVVLEMTIKVLSSQHENQFFRLKFQGLDTKNNNRPVPEINFVTDPIRVISKPEQLTRKKQAGKQKKRTITEAVVTTLERIEKIQQEHQQTLQALCEKIDKDQKTHALDIQFIQNSGPTKRKNSHPATYLKTETTEEASYSSPESELADEQPLNLFELPHDTSSPTSSPELAPVFDSEYDMSFHLNGLTAAFSMLQESDRPTKLRRVIDSASKSTIAKLNEIVDILWADRLQTSLTSGIVSPTAPVITLGCVDTHDFRKSSESLDEIYQSFLCEI